MQKKFTMSEKWLTSTINQRNLMFMSDCIGGGKETHP